MTGKQIKHSKVSGPKIYKTKKININVKWVSIVNLCNYRLVFT